MKELILEFEGYTFKCDEEQVIPFLDGKEQKKEQLYPRIDQYHRQVKTVAANCMDRTLSPYPKFMEGVNHAYTQDPGFDYGVRISEADYNTLVSFYTQFQRSRSSNPLEDLIKRVMEIGSVRTQKAKRAELPPEGNQNIPLNSTKPIN